MPMWLLLTGMLAVIPVLMLLIGIRFVRVRPQSRNCRIYYRTARSMRNDRTNRFAHQVCGKFYLLFGKGSLLVTVILSLIFLRLPLSGYETASGVWLLVETIMLIVAVPLTEKALLHRFGEKAV